MNRRGDGTIRKGDYGMKRQTTRELLAASFQELAQTKQINKITITQITDNCGMSQPTFYHHFRDKNDLIAWIEAENLNRILEKNREDESTWKDTLEDLAEYYIQNRAYILNALKNTDGPDCFADSMVRLNAEALSGGIQRRSGGEELPAMLGYYIRIYCYGTGKLLEAWLMGEEKLTKEEFTEILWKSVPDPLKPYLGL